jgi:hypothetical protein
MRLANGNTLLVNRHAGPENPQIIETSPAKQVVLAFRCGEVFGNSLPAVVLCRE